MLFWEALDMARSSRTEALRRILRPPVEEMASPAAKALSGPKNHFYREMICAD
jgi:hypothetical protein